MNPGFHLGCRMPAVASLSGRAVEQSSRAHLWPSRGRFSLSEHRRFSKRHQPGSGRFGIVVAKKQDLRAVRPAVSEPLRHGPSLREHGRRDGQVLRVPARRGGRSRLPSRADSLRPHAGYLLIATVAWHLAVRPQPEYRQVAIHANSRWSGQKICAQGRVFSQLRRCHGRWRIPDQLLALLTAPGGKRHSTDPVRGRSMKRTNRFHPARDAATAESRIRRMRGAR